MQTGDRISPEDGGDVICPLCEGTGKTEGEKASERADGTFCCGKLHDGDRCEICDKQFVNVQSAKERITCPICHGSGKVLPHERATR